MGSRYIPSARIKARHPALSSREELLKVMERYERKPSLAAKSMQCSPETVCKAMRDLAPDKLEEWRAEGTYGYGHSRSL